MCELFIRLTKKVSELAESNVIVQCMLFPMLYGYKKCNV